MGLGVGVGSRDPCPRSSAPRAPTSSSSLSPSLLPTPPTPPPSHIKHGPWCGGWQQGPMSAQFCPTCANLLFISQPFPAANPTHPAPFPHQAWALVWGLAAGTHVRAVL